MRINSKTVLFLFLNLLSVIIVQANQSVLKTPADTILGERIWALATLSVSNMRAQPSDASELVSQALMGTPMKVLEYKKGWFRVQTPEGYTGWMDKGELERFTGAQLDEWKTSRRYFFTRNYGTAFNSTNRKRIAVTDLVLGDLFEAETDSKGFLKIRIPDGRTGFVKKSDCISWKEWTTRKPELKSVLSVTNQLMGIPYLWGGTSAKAADCSGLTKTVYFSQGIILARDASQQALYGTHPDFRNLENLQSGDLIFFGRDAQHIVHVGIYIGNGFYVNASGHVRINSLDPNDPTYKLTEKKKLVAASRILNSLNTGGIVLVKDHPWYSLP